MLGVLTIKLCLLSKPVTPLRGFRISLKTPAKITFFCGKKYAALFLKGAMADFMKNYYLWSVKTKPPFE